MEDNRLNNGEFWLQILDYYLKSGKKTKLTAMILAIVLASSTPVAGLTIPKSNDGTPKLSTSGQPLASNDIVVANEIKGFKDVDVNNWAYESICKLQNIGAIKMTPTANFEPNRAATREEFTVMLMKALGVNANETTTKFMDVSTGDLSNAYINAASDMGIIFGTSEYQFLLFDKITREQAAAMLVRTFAAYGTNLEANTTKKFTDDSKISNWAKEAVYKATAAGAFMGYPDGRFGPKESITMAQIAQIIRKTVERIQNRQLLMPTNKGTALSTQEQADRDGLVFGPWEIDWDNYGTELELETDLITRRVKEVIPVRKMVPLKLLGNEEWSRIGFGGEIDEDMFKPLKTSDLIKEGRYIFEGGYTITVDGETYPAHKEKVRISPCNGANGYVYETRVILNKQQSMQTSVIEYPTLALRNIKR